MSQQTFVYTCWSGLLIHSWLIEPSGFRSFFLSLYMTSHVYIFFNLNLRYDSVFLSFMLSWEKILCPGYLCISFFAMGVWGRCLALFTIYLFWMFSFAVAAFCCFMGLAL